MLKLSIKQIGYYNINKIKNRNMLNTLRPLCYAPEYTSAIQCTKL